MAGGHAGRRRALVLLVFLLGAVVVGRVRVVLGVVGLVDVAVVRSRAVDRDRHVDVVLLAVCLAFSRLRCFVAVLAGLALFDLLAACAAFAGARVADRD